MKIVLASHNPGKIAELKALLLPLDIDLFPQSDVGVDDIEETGLSFIENALLKARHASRLTGLPAIADDSGLCVDALHGAPGIYSARYAGIKATSSDHIQKLLAELHAIPQATRDAFFYCALVFITHDNDPTPLICEGQWSGQIAQEPKGKQGFGYDPIFYLPDHQKTAAELSLAVKNKISHRAIALQLLINRLPKK